MALSTTDETIQRTRQRLSASGFSAQVLPAKRGTRGQGDFIVSASNTRKCAKVRVKGHGDVNDPCWFSLTFFEEDIQSALEKRIKRDKAWKCNVAKYDFFILVSLPLNRMWLFTPQEIVKLIEINLKQYDLPKERETHRKVEMNFDVVVGDEQLSQVKDYDDNLINESNNFTLLRSWLTN